MQVEPATDTDLRAVVELCETAAGQRGTGVGVATATPATLSAAQRAGRLQVVRDGRRLVGSVAVADTDPVVWPAEPVHGAAGYVRLLLAAPQPPEAGPAAPLLGWAERELGRWGCDVARLSVAASATEMRDWCERRGYVAWDTVAVEGGAPVVRCEKALTGAGPPGVRPLPPDRLTAFQRAVVDVVVGLRAGEVATYAEVAEEAARPGSAQAVANVLRAVPGLPWWRVVPSDGRIYRTHASRQVPRLRAEGVTVDRDRRVRG